MPRPLAAPLLAAALALPAAAPAAPRVVASIEPVHALVAGVMEGVAEPRLLVEGGQSPHTYSLAPSEAAALEEADLVVWVGPVLEAFLERPLASIAREDAVLRLAGLDGLDLLPAREGGAWEAHDHAHGHGGDHGHGGHAEAGHDGHEDGHETHDRAQHDHEGRDHGEHGHDDHAHGDHAMDAARIDPHLWLDPDNARAMVAAVAGRLAAIDPANAGAYRANAGALDARIAEADAALAERLAPVADVPYVVFHDAYQYFERHYGLAAVGSVTIGPERRPGARRLTEIRERIVSLDAACVFREPQFAPDLVETVVEDTGARVGTLDPLGSDVGPVPEAYPRLLRALADDLLACLAAEG